MKKTLYFFLFLLGVITKNAFALVNPDNSEIDRPDWYVEIYFRDIYSGNINLYCKGSLIDPEWVLTSQHCRADPFRALPSVEPPTHDQLFVLIGNDDHFTAVSSLVDAEDFSISLLKLATRSDNQFLKLSDLNNEDLYDTEVLVLGNASSQLIGNSIFNPVPENKLGCTIDGKDYYSNGAICYIVSSLKENEKFSQVKYLTKDPLISFAGFSLLDTFFSDYDHKGSYMYLATQYQDSFVCNEDIGSPVLRVEEDNSYSLVGVVSRVGISALLPICNGLFADVFHTAAYYSEFIEHTIAANTFSRQCPEAPEIFLEFIEGNRVRLFWDDIPAAESFRVHYTPREGYREITSVDVGRNLEFQIDLDEGELYTFALSAYTKKCSSGLSNRISDIYYSD